MNARITGEPKPDNAVVCSAGASMRHGEPLGEQSTLLLGAGFAHIFSNRAAKHDDARELDFAWSQGDSGYFSARALVAGWLRLDANLLHEVQQVHGAAVRVAFGSCEPRSPIAADALIAPASSGVAVGIRTADCVPVLIASQATGACVAIHAGWKGVALDIVHAALQALGEPTAPLLVAIGPCIGANRFEVGAEVAAQIAKASTPMAIRAHAPSKCMVDLRLAVRSQLQRRGVPAAQIEDVGGCTNTDADRYFSYRRDAERSGRLLSAIACRR